MHFYSSGSLGGDKKTFCWKWPYISRCLGNCESLHLTLFGELRCPTSHELCSQSHCRQGLVTAIVCPQPLETRPLVAACVLCSQSYWSWQHLFVTQFVSTMWHAFATDQIKSVGEFLDAKSLTHYQLCSQFCFSGNKATYTKYVKLYKDGLEACQKKIFEEWGEMRIGGLPWPYRYYLWKVANARLDFGSVQIFGTEHNVGMWWAFVFRLTNLTSLCTHTSPMLKTAVWVAQLSKLIRCIASVIHFGLKLWAQSCVRFSEPSRPEPNGSNPARLG